MSSKNPAQNIQTMYIATASSVHRPEKIGSVLEKRMKEFVRARRRRLRREARQ